MAENSRFIKEFFELIKMLFIDATVCGVVFAGNRLEDAGKARFDDSRCPKVFRKGA